MILIISGYVGYRSMQPTDIEIEKSKLDKASNKKWAKNKTIVALPDKVDSRSKIPASYTEDEEKILRGEKLLRFKTAAEYESFLRQAHAEGLKINGSIKNLRVVRVVFDRSTRQSDFLARFNDVELVVENDTVETPEPVMQTSAVGFKSDPLNFLGVKSTEGWGKGVTVAVVDSGIVDHRAIQSKVKHFDLIGGADGITSHHGTAVASLIAGDSNHIKGVSPAVSLLDFRALSDDGQGNAFTVSSAIVMAADQGAQIINLSLGTQSDNPILFDAVNYALDKGVILVAAVGNEGAGKVSYPAAYEGVVGVGAIDALENYQGFSNRGPEVDIVAPGVEVKAASFNESIIYFSGTSAAAPIVSGALAYKKSVNPEMSNEELIDFVKQSSNDAGPPGSDNYYGEGILNVGRMEASTAGVYKDIAASGFFLEPVIDRNSYKLTFSAENRGNTKLASVVLSFSYPDFEKTYTFYDVEASQTVYDYIEVPADSRLLNGDYELLLKAKTDGGEEILNNNVKAARIRLNPQSSAKQ